MLFVSIPTPCHEDWNKMSPNEQGAFCRLCSKTVVDFTKMSDDEVKNYFLQHREQKTCGHFRNEQLTDSALPWLLKQPIPLWKKFIGIVLILFGSFMTGCKDNNQKESTPAPVLGESMIMKQTTGKPILEEPVKVDTIENLVCTVTDGFTATEIVGDIDIIGPPDVILVPDTAVVFTGTVSMIIPDQKGADGKTKNNNQ